MWNCQSRLQTPIAKTLDPGGPSHFAFISVRLHLRCTLSPILCLFAYITKSFNFHNTNLLTISYRCTYKVAQGLGTRLAIKLIVESLNLCCRGKLHNGWLHRVQDAYIYTTASWLSVLWQTLMVQPLIYSHPVLSPTKVSFIPWAPLKSFERGTKSPVTSTIANQVSLVPWKPF